jgi:hypothetical protein
VGLPEVDVDIVERKQRLGGAFDGKSAQSSCPR